MRGTGEGSLHFDGGLLLLYGGNDDEVADSECQPARTTEGADNDRARSEVGHILLGACENSEGIGGEFESASAAGRERGHAVFCGSQLVATENGRFGGRDGLVVYIDFANFA